MYRLLADAELLLGDDGAVAVDVFALQVVEKATTLADEHLQGALGGVVFVILFQVLGQVTDAIREQGNLCLGRTGIGFAFSVLLEDLYFFLRIQIHS